MVDNRRVTDPSIQLSSSVEGYWGSLSSSKDFCSDRGYHLVGSEPDNPNPDNPSDERNLMICGECDLFFSKYEGYVKYRVEGSG